MKYNDLLSMSFQNLFRRKLRTALTVIGVVIGTCSIVLMVSLGVGLDRSYSQQIANWADITMIDVFAGDGESGKESPGFTLDDDAIAYISSLPHVVGVSPMMMLDGQMLKITSGRYQYNGTVVAMNLPELIKMGYELKNGEIPTKDDGENVIVVGKDCGYAFYDPNKMSMDEGDIKKKPPPVDVLNDNIKISLLKNPSNNSLNMPTSLSTTSATEVPITGKGGGTITKLKTTGQFKANQAKDYNTLEGIYISVDFARNLQKQYAKINGIKDPFKAYTNAKIKVDSFENVDEIEKQIKSLGFQTYSAKQDLNQAKSTSRTIQLVLGALGGISLLVAAIGITNTMIMSIYERTREIGVMKVLGCELKNIRRLFLLEAGGIGFLGGVIGLVLSYILSFTINKVSVSFMGDMGMATNISQIPPWLALFGIVFSILVGIISGYAPANRAVKISALSAIRTE